MNLFDIAGSRSMAAGVAVSAASIALPVMFGTSETSAKVDLQDGAAWLSSEAAGNVVRVNGETGRVDARLDLGEIAGELLVSEGDGVVLVRLGDQVRSIDLANLDWGASAEAGAGTGLIVGDRAAYMVSLDGEVRQLDPTTLDTIGEVDLEASPTGAGVVADGRLVLPVDDGSVRVVDGDEIAASVDAGAPDDALHVTLLGDTIAVLNESEQTVQQVDVADGSAGDPIPVELPAGELLVPTELPGGHLWATAIRSGELVGVHIDGSDPTVTVPVAEPRHTLTAPVVAEDRVYLVDKTAAEIVAVDASSHEVVHREPLGVADASRVELVVEGDKVFVNDRASELAVVIDGDEYTRVDKYSEEGVASNTPSDLPDPDAGASTDPAPAPAPTPGAGGPAAPAPVPPPPPTGPPAAPASVTATPGNASATVSWTPGGGQHAPTGYHVTYAGGGRIDVPAGQLSVTVDGLTNGDTYAFEVWASNEHGSSDRVASNEVVPNDEVPGAPSRVEAVDGDASATVTWSEADGRGNDIAGYIVEASPATVPPVRVSGDETSAEITGLTNETPYTFTVRAINDLDVQSDPSPPSNQVTPYGPPGPVSAPVVSEHDGRVDLSWTAAPSHTTPVTYDITASPAAEVPSTTETSVSIGGLSNGVQYTFTIVPSNDRGAGQGYAVQATPGRQPTINNVAANRTGDRTFRVTFDVDNGGRAITGCSVARSGGDSVNCDASSGSVSVEIDVPQFNTRYEFTPSVTNSFGTGTGGPASGTSNGKPLVVEASRQRWDGACTWAGHENQRPRYSTANHECGTAIGWVNGGNTVRGLCHQQGGQIQDDNFVQSNQWIRVDAGGYMSTLYFEGYQNTQNVISGLPTCG